MLVNTKQCLLLLFWLAGLPLGAQTADFLFQHLGKEKGLEDVEFNPFVSHDSRGFYWIGSDRGPYRFDGQRAKALQLPIAQGTPNPNLQSKFWEDSQGDLWFTTHGGFYVYERKLGRFRPISLDGKSKSATPTCHIFYLEPRRDVLWLQIDSQIWCYAARSEEPWRKHPNATRGRRFAIDTAKAGQVQGFLACPWIIQGLEYHYLDRDGQWRKKEDFSSFLDTMKVFHALFQEDTLAWVFTNGGLLRINPLTGAHAGPFFPPDRPGLSFKHGAFYGGKTQLLLSSDTLGLWWFDCQSQDFLGHWRAEPANPFSLATDKPFEIYVDAHQQLWVSHHGHGLNYTTFAARQVMNPMQRNGLPLAPIVELIEDRLKRVWVLTKAQGVYVFGLDGALRREIPFPLANPGSRNDPLRSISIDARGRIWGLSERAIYFWEGSLAYGAWVKALTSDKLLFALDHIAPERTLVLTGQGVFDLVPSGHEKYRLRRSQEFSHLTDFPFMSFAKGNSELVFLPYHASSLWAVEQRTDGLAVRDTFALGGDVYSAFRFPGSDSVWLGTELGLYLYHAGQLKLAFQEAWQKENYRVSSVLGGTGRQLWLATNRGLRRYDLETGSLFKFSEQDGLPSDIFQTGAGLVASDGRLWFGTDKGLAVFFPHELRLDAPAPLPHVENIWVNGVAYQSDEAISEIERLELPHLRNNFDFQLIAVGAYRAESSSLRYRLKGFDDEWQLVANGGWARFANVPYGNYQLEIVALNANGREGGRKTVEISIRPPLWQRWEFWMAVSIVFVGLIILAIRHHYRRKLREERAELERQKALQAERDRIAKELHDDLGGELSNILYIIDDLLFDASPGAQQAQLERAAALSQSAIENMRDFIWAKDDSKNKLRDLAEKLLAFVPDYLDDHKLASEIRLEEAALPDAELGFEKRRNAYLIVKEALHNIAKHAQASKVDFALWAEGGELCIDIRDDGKGFVAGEGKPSGYGLSNMQRRAADSGGQLRIQSSPGAGTALRLRLPL